MSLAESVTFWGAVALYVAGVVTMFGGVVFGRRRLVEASTVVVAVGLSVHAAAIAARWSASGHFPYIEDYENVLVGTFVMVAAYLLVTWRWRGLAVAGVLVLPVTLLTMGYGVTQYTGVSPVTPVYQSAWLVVHVTFAWITYATYSAVAGLAVALLVRDRAERRGVQPAGVPAWIPASERIDSLSFRLVAFGFLNNAVMIASGAIWAYRLWGSYWRWDPVETWSLLTWLAYGLYMHAHLTLGWRGRRLAWLALFALFGVLMTFWGVQILPNTYHLFDSIGTGIVSRPGG
ncbi:MAG: cytochrome C biogenesis protein [Actinobacteria bacterium]|nr:MAG: cytochrome C biogenesis protein [Actinomycetota bacterium]